jgi:hypothetical protein
LTRLREYFKLFLNGIRLFSSRWDFWMNHIWLPVVVQLSLTFGIAGLFWPEKFLRVFEVLMFPWAASHRLVRAHSVAALLLSAVLFVGLVAGIR